MYHPDPEKIRTAMDRMERAVDASECPKLAMRMGHIEQRPVEVAYETVRCGTFACVGGWYALATIRHNDWPHAWKGGTAKMLRVPIEPGECGDLDYDYPGTRGVGYDRDGAQVLARDIGFPHRQALERWGADNPDLWGNKCGELMFSEVCAYRPDPLDEPEPPTDSVTVHEVIAHWRAVADRIEGV